MATKAVHSDFQEDCASIVFCFHACNWYSCCSVVVKSTDVDLQYLDRRKWRPQKKQGWFCPSSEMSLACHDSSLVRLLSRFWFAEDTQNRREMETHNKWTAGVIRVEV